jgi:regulator of protease activity HflC (stomatin/prohibitin superfamily)
MDPVVLTIVLIVAVLLIIAGAALYGFPSVLQRVIVFEYERGLLYHNGKFKQILEPGQHWISGVAHTVQKVDVRTRSVSIAGQEVLSADNITIRISLAATFKVADPYQVVVGAVNYLEELYLYLQTELRDMVGALPIDELLAKRKQIGEQLFENTKERARALGVELITVSIKDIMFPGDLKNIFAQVVSARNEGLAALERARGESAALRNLANAAKLLEDNPGLYQLRVLQTIASSTGNTIILAPSGEGAGLAGLGAKNKKT